MTLFRRPTFYGHFFRKAVVITAAAGAFTASESDGLAFADTPSTALAVAAVESDGIGFADTPLGALAVASSASDGLGLGDTPSTLLAAVGAESDGLGIGDAASVLFPSIASESDGLGLADTPSSLLAVFAAESDGVGFGDTPDTVLGLASETDGIGFGDTPSTLLAVFASKSDGLGLGDTPSTFRAFLVSVSDGIGFGDVGDTVLGAASATDGIGFGDTPSTLLVVFASESDGLGIGDTPDSLRAYVVSASDGLGLGDTPLATHGFPTSASDGLGLGDTPLSLLAAIATESDGLGVGDTEATNIAAHSDESDGLGLGDTQTIVFTPVSPPFVGKFGPEHASALADVLAGGSPVTFTSQTSTYTPATDLMVVSETTLSGQGLRVGNDPRIFAELGLVEADAVTLLFVPSSYDRLAPTLGDSCAWGGLTHRVAKVELLAPDGGVILARVVMSLEDQDAQSLAGGFKYAAEHADALRDIGEAGADVTFTYVDSDSYTAATDLLVPATTTVTGKAMRVKGNPLQYQELGLVELKPITLLWAPTTYGEVPRLGSTVVFDTVTYRVRALSVVSPDAGAIIGRAVLSL